MASTATPEHTRVAGERVFFNLHRVATQTNVAGGFIAITIRPVKDSAIKINMLGVSGDANANSFGVRVRNSAGNDVAILAGTASAANLNFYLPSHPAASATGTADGNFASSEQIVIPDTHYIIIFEGAASVQNHTMTIDMCLEILGRVEEPTISTAGSVNPADVTFPANTLPIQDHWVRLKDVI